MNGSRAVLLIASMALVSCTTLRHEIRQADESIRTIFGSESGIQHWTMRVLDAKRSPSERGPARLTLQYFDERGELQLRALLLARKGMLDFGSIKGALVESREPVETATRDQRMEATLRAICTINNWLPTELGRPGPKDFLIEALARPLGSRLSYQINEYEPILFDKNSGWLLMWGSPGVPHGD